MPLAIHFHRVPLTRGKFLLDAPGVPSLCPLSLFSSPFPPVPIQIAPRQIQLHGEEEEGPATQVSSDLTALSFPGLLLMEKGALKEVLGDVWASQNYFSHLLINPVARCVQPQIVSSLFQSVRDQGSFFLSSRTSHQFEQQ